MIESAPSLDTGLAEADRLQGHLLRAEPSLAGRLVSMRLPRRLVPTALGVRMALLGGSAAALLPGPRRRAVDQLRLVLPPATSDRVRRRVARGYMGERLAFLDLFFRPGLREIELIGEEHLADARRGGRGAIIAIMHFGLWWAISLALLQRGVKVYVVRYRGIEEDPIHRGLLAQYGVERLRLHEKLGGRVIGRGGSYPVLEALLTRGEVCSLNADPPSASSTSPATLFRGRRFRFATGIGRLSKGTGVAIVPALAFREGTRPVVRLLPPLEPDQFPDIEGIQVRVSTLFDEALAGREEVAGAQLLLNLRAALIGEL